MTPAELATARGVARIAARAPLTHPERVTAVRRVLASLGLLPYDVAGFDPLPTDCGHPSSALMRRGVTPGLTCRVCLTEYNEHRRQVRAATRGAAR